MSPADTAVLLLFDALDRTAANPLASHCWINLMTHTRALTDPVLLQQLIAQVSARMPESGLAGFYRNIYLDIATGDFRYAGQAAAILADVQPRDQDRLAAFLNLCWQRSLLYAFDRPSFVRNLHTMGVPALTRLVGYPAHLAPACATVSARLAQPLRRVALIAPTLRSPQHPPTRMALDQAEVLALSGIAVSIFSCQEALVPDWGHLLGGAADNQPSLGQELEECRAVASTHSQLTVSDHRYSLMRRWHDMLPAIEAAQPDVVMLVGLHSGLIDCLYQRYPVLGLATNSVAPFAPTDVWLTAQPALHGEVGDYWQSGQPASLAMYHPFRAHRRQCGAAVERRTLAVPEDAVLMISVGNRLADQIDSRWAARMGALLAAHPQLHWLLLGGRGQLPPALEPYAQQRIHSLAHAENVMELMASCDIYLNPPMMGGGLSVSEAMSLGLPVVSMADSDGGDKLGSAAMLNEDAYFAQLQQWIADRPARVAAGKALRQYFSQTIDLAHSGPSLLAACEQARQRFMLRCASPE